MSLRIAFFGSDRFSIQSLVHLLRLQAKSPQLVGSIDVITRKLKPQGRNLKLLQDLAVGEFATTNKVNVIRADTLSEIIDCLKQNQFNIAVAVSYGKLIPRAFLDEMEFGGLNVHPSLLPRYSGSSPIQNALMNDDKYTGVTVQTLHPTKFDKGQIIKQSEEIPIEDSDNYSTLESKLGDLGGELLSNVLENGLYINPPMTPAKYDYSLASKIDPTRAQISWDATSRQIKRLSDALGPLYTHIYCNPLKKNKTGTFKRVILQGIQESRPASVNSEIGSFVFNEATSTIDITTSDGTISVRSLTFECFNVEDANTFFKRVNKRTNKASHNFIYR